MYLAAVLMADNAPDAKFQLAYEADIVKINTSEESPELVRATERWEVVPGTQWSRHTTTSPGRKYMLQILDNVVTLETLQPNGVLERKEMPMKQFASGFTSMIKNEFGTTVENLANLSKRQPLNDFKYIAGVKCQKVLTHVNVSETASEMIAFEPTEAKLRALKNSFETYMYSVEGSTKRLVSAETVVSFRRGDTK